MFHTIRGHTILLSQLTRSLDRRMHHVTGSMVFEEITPNVPAMFRRFQYAFRMVIWAVSAGETLLALDDVDSAGETTHRQLRRHQSVIGCFPRMQGFAHCPEH